jgi:membrane protease YdiL (CAAX protease family)
MPPAGVKILSQTILGSLLVLGLAGVVISWAWAIFQIIMERPLLPRSASKAVPWGIGSIVLVIVLRLGMEIPVGAAYFAIHGKPQVVAAQKADAKVKKPTLSAIDMLWLVSLTNLSVIVVTPLVLRATSGATLDDLGLPGRPIFRNAFRGFVAYFLLAPIVFGTFLIAQVIWIVVLHHQRNPHPVEIALENDLSWPTVTLAVIGAVVLAPVAEELLLRGVLLGWLTRVWNRIPSRGSSEETFPEPNKLPELQDQWPASIADPSPAVDPYFVEDPPKARPSLLVPNLIVSIIFALLHTPQWPTPVPIFFLSLGLGILYQKTGSLTASIALHALFNGLSTAMMYLVVLSGLKGEGDKLLRPAPVPPPARAAVAAPKIVVPPVKALAH